MAGPHVVPFNPFSLCAKTERIITKITKLGHSESSVYRACTKVQGKTGGHIDFDLVLKQVFSFEEKERCSVDTEDATESELTSSEVGDSVKVDVHKTVELRKTISLLEHKNRSLVDKVEELEKTVKQYADKIRCIELELDDIRVKTNCKICWAALPKVVLEPCKHWGFCVSCSEELTDCPICRGTIYEKKQVYVV